MKQPLSQKDLLRWKSFQDVLPRTIRGLIKFCDDLKLDYETWKDVNSRIIILELMKLLETNGISVQKIRKKLADYPESADIMKQEWIKKYFDSRSDKKYKKEGKNKSKKITTVNDNEIYNHLFSKLIDLLLTCD